MEGKKVEVLFLVVPDSIEGPTSLNIGNGSLNNTANRRVIREPPIPSQIYLIPSVNSPLSSIYTKVPGSLNTSLGSEAVATKVAIIIVIFLGIDGRTKGGRVAFESPG